MQDEKKELVNSAIIPVLWILLLWLIKLIEVSGGVSFFKYGIYPRVAEGLIGIVSGPFIHGDFSHLLNNTFPILVLGTSLFYFYKEIAYKVFTLIYFTSGFWLWFMGRPSFHIGASAVIYGLASFLFFSGVIRKQKQLMVISLLVVFLYGSMVWGVLPINYEISFEGHLTGALAGIVYAYYFRNKGPQRKPHVWEDEEEEDEKENPENVNQSDNTSITEFSSIVYNIKSPPK